jgi:hypothetical protein
VLQVRSWPSGLLQTRESCVVALCQVGIYVKHGVLTMHCPSEGLALSRCIKTSSLKALNANRSNVSTIVHPCAAPDTPLRLVVAVGRHPMWRCISVHSIWGRSCITNKARKSQPAFSQSWAAAWRLLLLLLLHGGGSSSSMEAAAAAAWRLLLLLHGGKRLDTRSLHRQSYLIERQFRVQPQTLARLSHSVAN